jgi:uncharacterized membrane protein
MTLKRLRLESGNWAIPLFYALAALVAGLTIPRLEARFWPKVVSPMSVTAVLAIYSSIASGMIALTSIVFSLTFVMVQFSATAYSPRLVLWIARDPVTSHALGTFTATFLYAVAAISGVDRSGSGKAPFGSVWLVVGLLLASIAMFISLLQRIGLLQVNRMLRFTGDQGRRVIDALYLSRTSVFTAGSEELFRSLPTQTIIHRGTPRVIQAVDVEALVSLASRSGGVIEMVAAVGDTVFELTPLLRVFCTLQAIDEGMLRKGIELGGERTFAQDPKYAIRLVVDIAIKALSPAVNDPTTAVQALDQIEDLLLRLGHRRLDIGGFCDGNGKLRLSIPFPAWEDFLRLAFEEIRAYGANSLQVMRRMNALVGNLIRTLPEERRAALRYWRGRLQATVARSFADTDEKNEASVGDQQGLGISRRNPECM